MALHREADVFLQNGANHLGFVAVDDQPETFLHELVGNLGFFQREDAALAGCLRQLNRLFNQLLRRVLFEHEGADRYLRRAQELAQAEFHHGDHDRAAKHDDHRGRVHEHGGVAADDDGRHDNDDRTDQPYKSG